MHPQPCRIVVPNNARKVNDSLRIKAIYTATLENHTQQAHHDGHYFNLTGVLPSLLKEIEWNRCRNLCVDFPIGQQTKIS